MIQKIQEHHTNEEIEIIKLQNEIKQWKSELNFVADEIQFYNDILNSISNKNRNNVETEFLCEQFFNLKEINKTILKSCETFHPKLEEMNECEDVQCNHVYISSHLSLSSKIEKHISDVRKIKYKAFTYLKNEIEKF